MLDPVRRLIDRAWALFRRSPFARNVSSTFAVQILSLVITIANAAIIARTLGPSGKGVLAMLLLVPSVFALFLGGGIGVANVYYAGQRRFDIPTLSANSMAFVLVASALGVVVAIVLYLSGLLTKILPGIPLGLLAIAMLGLPLSLLSGYYTGILQGLQQILQINLVTFLQRVLTLALTILFVLVAQWNITGALLASLLASASATATLTLLLRRRGAVLRPRLSRPVMRTTLNFGLRGYVANVLQYFNYRLDLFLVNYFLGPSGVGIYTVSVSMAEMLWYLPNAVSFVIFPKAANSTQEAMNRFTPRVFRATLALTALGAVVLALVGKPFIEIVYSAKFVPAYVPLLALLPGVVLLGGGKVLTNDIAGRGYPQYNSIASGASLVITVILDLLLIPRLGVLGASLASSASYTAIFFLALFFYRMVANRPRPSQPASAQP